MFRLIRGFNNNSKFQREKGEHMKKIWPWLLLLLLLILFCVWSKKDTITVHKSTQTETAKSLSATQKRQSIDYTIAQKDTEYLLSGNFSNMQQQERLKETIVATSNVITINATHTDDSLTGDKAIVLTNNILPHFTKHYKNGKIVYADNTLRIYGEADSYEAQRKMQQLLSLSTLPSQDNTSVLIAQKPIVFTITKKEDSLALHGTFGDANQINTLTSKLPTSATIEAKSMPNYTDKGAVNTTEQILTLFMQKYKDGTIVYKDDVLTISGTVPSENDINAMDTLLGKATIKTINHTTIDQEAVSKRNAEAEARLQQEATLKAEATAARAKAEATRKAQEETQRLAQEQTKQKAKEKAEIQEKITQLLQIENIEFEVNKAILTPKSKGTVDKLARILKAYSDIRIEIAGHTDSDGSEMLNQTLSQSRVDTVRTRLISKGIHSGRLTAKGYGESKPLVPNTSRENKQTNRRVEFNIQGE